MADLVILGGGASGLMAAVSAARFIPGKNISILERGPRVGKKLLVTGNGRCNLTNLELDFSRYHGAPESFVSAVFSQLPPKDTLSLFGRLGLLCREEGQGRCYPYGGQASAVLDVLRRYLEGRNVEERCQTSVETVKRKPGGYELKTSGGVVFAKRLILASGGRAMPSSGSDGSGLKLAASLGLKASEPFPSLAPVRAASPVLKAVKGLRCRGRASLLADRKTVKQETGEIQFTDQGLSGICILNLSRLVGEFFFSQNRQQAQNGESRALSRFSAGFGLFLAALIFAGADLRAAAPARGAAVIRNRQQAGWIGFAQTAHALRPFPPLRQPVPFRIKNDLPHRQGLALLSHGNPGLAAGSIHRRRASVLSVRIRHPGVQGAARAVCLRRASGYRRRLRRL